MDSKFAITYRITKIGCNEAIQDNEIPGWIELTLDTICLGDVKNTSYCIIDEDY